MGDIATLVSGIEYKVRKLITRNQSLKDENEKLKKEIEALKRTNTEQTELLRKSEEKVNIIKLAKTLETKEGNVEAKLKINELVREIDKCIGLLNT
jgi:predicted RNase H-like nuclease (RuvC/YqgF family)